MKRRILALLLAVLTLTMLTAAAFAADATEAGAYYIRTEAGYTLTVEDAASDGGFYKGASKFKLSCENLPGQYSLVFLINTDTAQTTTVVPTETNLYYIDQKDVSTTTEFELVPKQMTAGVYNIYVSTDGTDGLSLKKVGSFRYGEKSAKMLGDVSEDGAVDTKDALWILQAFLGDRSVDEEVADVNFDNAVDTGDALRVLQYFVGDFDSFYE